jgi:hypothetical protein
MWIKYIHTPTQQTTARSPQPAARSPQPKNSKLIEMVENSMATTMKLSFIQLENVGKQLKLRKKKKNIPEARLWL